MALVLSSCKEDEPEYNGIELNANDFRAVYAPNKTLTFGYLDKTKITVPVEGADQTWDYRNVKSSSSPYTNTYKAVPDNSGFNSATYMLEAVPSLGVVSFTNGQYFYEVSDEGWYSLGTKVLAQTLNLPNNVILAATGAGFAYSPKLMLHKFPMTYQSTYSSTAIANEVYMLTAPALGLTSATPATRKVTSELNSSITGWGKLYLPDVAEPIEVLQVRVMDKVTNNYLLGTSPAPAQLLAGLGLTEGSSSTITYYAFFAKNRGLVAEVGYEGPNINYGVYQK
jgi:hypothetical protein